MITPLRKKGKVAGIRRVVTRSYRKRLFNNSMDSGWPGRRAL